MTWDMRYDIIGCDGICKFAYTNTRYAINHMQFTFAFGTHQKPFNSMKANTRCQKMKRKKRAKKRTPKRRSYAKIQWQQHQHQQQHIAIIRFKGWMKHHLSFNSLPIGRVFQWKLHRAPLPQTHHHCHRRCLSADIFVNESLSEITCTHSYSFTHSLTQLNSIHWNCWWQ